MFLDESGFLLIPTVQRTWAPRGDTPILRHRYNTHDKVSAISAVTVSPRRQRCGRYALYYLNNITQDEVVCFLRLLLRHLLGSIILLWDGGSVHRGPIVRQFLARHTRLHAEAFPAYAPELNPDELVWSYMKRRLANGAPEHVDDLLDALTAVTGEMRRTPTLLRACVVGSDLPTLFRR